MLLTPAEIKSKSFESFFVVVVVVVVVFFFFCCCCCCFVVVVFCCCCCFVLFFTRGGCASCLRAWLGARLLPQSYQYPNLSKGADRVAGQLRGDRVPLQWRN